MGKLIYLGFWWLEIGFDCCVCHPGEQDIFIVFFLFQLIECIVFLSSQEFCLFLQILLMHLFFPISHGFGWGCWA